MVVVAIHLQGSMKQGRKCYVPLAASGMLYSNTANTAKTGLDVLASVRAFLTLCIALIQQALPELQG